MSKKITDEHKLACAMRELKIRIDVYPRRVASGHMSVDRMNHEIEAMSAIVQDYENAVAQTRLPL